MVGKIAAIIEIAFVFLYRLLAVAALMAVAAIYNAWEGINRLLPGRPCRLLWAWHGIRTLGAFRGGWPAGRLQKGTGAAWKDSRWDEARGKDHDFGHRFRRSKYLPHAGIGEWEPHHQFRQPTEAGTQERHADYGVWCELKNAVREVPACCREPYKAAGDWDPESCELHEGRHGQAWYPPEVWSRGGGSVRGTVWGRPLYRPWDLFRYFRDPLYARLRRWGGEPDHTDGGNHCKGAVY